MYTLVRQHWTSFFPHVFWFLEPDGARFPSLGRPVTFEVDTCNAGLGELAIKCQGPKGNVPVDVRQTTPGKYNVCYTPDQQGQYDIRFHFNGQDIIGSPYTTFVTDPTAIVAQGDGLQRAVADSQAEFTVSLYGGAQKRQVDAHGEGPDGRFAVHLQESPDSPNSLNLSYIPKGVGEHKIYVSHANHPVRGSPFTVKVADPSQVKFTSELPQHYELKGDVDVPLSVPSSAGEGDIEASVVGPDQKSVPVNVVKEADDVRQIRFLPRMAGEHTVHVTFAGREVSGSPYKVQVHDKVEEEQPLRAVQEVRQTEREKPGPGFSRPN